MERSLVEIIHGVGIRPCLEERSNVRVVQRRMVQGSTPLQIGCIYITSGCNQQQHDGYLLVLGSDHEGRPSEPILRVNGVYYFRHKCAHPHIYNTSNKRILDVY